MPAWGTLDDQLDAFHERMAARTVLTVDIEPDWGIQGTQAYRTVTARFLRFLEERAARATFFVVSDLLDDSEDEVRAVIAAGHEVGSHGRSHRLLSRLGRDEVRRELAESRARLSSLGAEVIGFRAPFFCRSTGLAEDLAAAGYRYDASLGSVLPGLHNGRLAARACPFRNGRAWQFATSAMAGGVLPMSLTWLRVAAPVSGRMLSSRSGLVYLHLHEFLPPDTAACVPWPLRAVLTRRCGEPAWDILARAMDALGGPFTTCREALRITVEATEQQQ